MIKLDNSNFPLGEVLSILINFIVRDEWISLKQKCQRGVLPEKLYHCHVILHENSCR